MKFISAFSFFIPMVSLYSLFFLFVPVVHLYENKANVFALQVDVDNLSMIIGLPGVFTVMALVQLHRRLSAIEKAILSGKRAE